MSARLSDAGRVVERDESDCTTTVLLDGEVYAAGLGHDEAEDMADDLRHAIRDARGWGADEAQALAGERRGHGLAPLPTSIGAAVLAHLNVPGGAL